MPDGSTHVLQVQIIPDAAEPFAPGLAPGYRPGERMLAGKPYVFNGDRLAIYLAFEGIRSAPADLTRISEAALRQLSSHCTAISWLSDRDPARTPEIVSQMEALRFRVVAERNRRGWTH